MKFKEILKYVAIPLVAGGLIGVVVWQVAEHVNKVEDTPPSAETPAPDDNTGGQENPLTFNVKFKSEDTELSSQDVSVGGYSTLPEEPTKEGYNFLGYALEGTTEIVDPLTYPITEKTVFVAVFEEVVVEYLPYTIENYKIIKYTGTETDVVVPSTYSLDAEGKAIVGTDIVISEIGSNAFENLEFLKSVVLADTIDCLAEGVFYNCSNLESVTLGENIDYVEQCFIRLDNLKEIIIKNETVPSLFVLSSSYGGGRSHHADLIIYVPDVSIEAYKEFLFDYADRIHGISELDDSTFGDDNFTEEDDNGEW